MLRNEKKGFTLVELLAVIAVLSLVLGLVVFIAINVIDNAREKSYRVTIENIENEVSTYLYENSGRLFYISKVDEEDIKYQCVTVQNLIDFGYFDENIFKSKVSDDKYVSKDDYIYIEKNGNTNAIVKTKYLIDEDLELCDIAVVALGNVNISVTPDGWSSDKEITITYEIKNANDVNNYVYKYAYDNDNIQLISDDGMVKKIRVIDNGKIRGYIEYNNQKVIAEATKEITDIDKLPPIITINEDLVKIQGTSFDLYEGVTITDNSEIISSKKIYLGDKEITSYEELSLGVNMVTYTAVDNFGNKSSVSRKITLIVAEEEFDYKESDQIYQVMLDGTYLIEAYGAQGGNSGGAGGYVKAEVELSVGNQLIINTGGMNGYNGGGGYKNSNYKPGGGATTIKYNNNLIIIAGGGGAKGTDGTGGAGGSAGNTGAGGTDVGAGTGLSGSNGGGGSNSLDYKYECNCKTCGGGCSNYISPFKCECETISKSCNCVTTYSQCNCKLTSKSCNCRTEWYIDGYYSCDNFFGCMFPQYSSRQVCDTCYSEVCSRCSQEVCDTCYEEVCSTCGGYCASYHPTYKCDCKTCTKKGKSGMGGINNVKLPAAIISNVSGARTGNGYVKISYKLEV